VRALIAGTLQPTEKYEALVLSRLSIQTTVIIKSSRVESSQVASQSNLGTTVERRSHL